ncbi:uncharacterized protein LOC143882280 [Tasmannia lanceolata]|uniref:uncharacterized protein LOC143882280 n=1 Tax=Tasmannia lanceolata TaxID=3420 RepID=UPI0040639C16
MSVAKLRACTIPDAMKPEQKAGKPEKEGHDSIDNFIRHAIGKDPFLSFSRAGESPVQWIQLLHALDQQGTNKLSKGLKVDNSLEVKELPQEPYNGMSGLASEMNGVDHSIKGSGVPVKRTRSTSEHMQTLKIPEAVVAFAQAAAKANGEPEKYLSGWPLLAPSKVQMQKCDKCSREFCSPINYRRHIRVHRRSLNIDKDSPKNREFLGAFWDKLSLDEAKEILSFKNVTLEEVDGSSIIRALASFVRKPGFSSLPPAYVKAGTALLDVVQANPSRFPVSSQDLFSILDNASEKTFLCGGTAISMQKFVFDGEAGKIGLETKNLVACTSFLVEQRLVKAWVADKDAEALRCQELLVEEEEAAQKRKVELLEKRRLKKLRQKEQKTKMQINRSKMDFKEGSPDTVMGISFSEEMSSAQSTSDSDSNPPEPSSGSVQLFLEPIQSLDANMEVEKNIYQVGPGDADLENIYQVGPGDADLEMACGNADMPNCQGSDSKARELQGSGPGLLQKALKNRPNGFHLGQVPVSKSEPMQKYGNHRGDQRAVSLANGHKVWTQKTKLENEGKSLSGGVQRDPRGDQPDQNCQLLIGSISVSVGDCNGHHQVDTLASDHQSSKGVNFQEKPIKPDGGQNGSNRSLVKYWRPVGRHEVGGSVSIESNKREAEFTEVSGKASEDAEPMGLPLFSSRVAEAFLAQRWKEAIAEDHVTLVLTSERSNKPKFRTKAEKVCRLKYIPKNRDNS